MLAFPGMMLGSLMTDMNSAHVEFERKWMPRQGAGKRQLRMWLRFPSSVERNTLFQQMTTKDHGKWIARASFNGQPVEAHKPQTRASKTM